MDKSIECLSKKSLICSKTIQEIEATMEYYKECYETCVEERSKKISERSDYDKAIVNLEILYAQENNGEML